MVIVEQNHAMPAIQLNVHHVILQFTTNLTLMVTFGAKNVNVMWTGMVTDCTAPTPAIRVMKTLKEDSIRMAK